MKKKISTIRKIDIIKNELEEIFSENEWKPIQKEMLIQRLESFKILQILELDKEFINNIIEEFIKDGTLSKTKPNYIVLKRENNG